MFQSSQILQHLNPEILNLAQTYDNYLQTLSQPGIFNVRTNKKGCFSWKQPFFVVVLLNQ